MFPIALVRFGSIASLLPRAGHGPARCADLFGVRQHVNPNLATQRVRALVTGAKQQAGIAVRVKAITALDRVRIGPLHGLEPGERRYQHEQRRTR